jgi:UDP-N-acetylglucosamine 3-dehydrogenase
MKRVAVIGVGSMGKNHSRVLHEIPSVKLAAVADEDPEKAREIGERYGVRAYTDYRRMIAEQRPDAVTVATPTSTHFDVVDALLRSGCHVMVEKPIASTVEQARSLVATSQEQGSLLMVGHIERHNPAVLELKRRLEMNQLGQIFQLHARRLGPFPTRIQDVGVIMDLAPHDLDIMRYLTGSEVIRVYAETKRILHSSQDDLLAGLIRFDSGCLGVLEINWLTPVKIRELCVTGERGMFRVNYITQDLYFYENGETNGENWSAISLLRGVSEGMIIQYPIKKREPLRVELEAFISAIEGESQEAGNALDALVALDLVNALKQASQTGETTRLDKGWELTVEQFPGLRRAS